MRVAFLGFSEAGPALARVMIAHGATVAACDPGVEDPARGPALRGRAEGLRVPLHAEPRGALDGAALVVSAVTAGAALPAAEGAAPLLVAGQVYLDLNSCGPATKAAVARAVAPSGAGFCEGALMGLVAGAADRVPILLCGPEAGRTTATLGRLGLVASDLGPELGAASTVKLLRSIFVKGLEALLDETLTAAEAAGVRGSVLTSLASTFTGRDFHALAEHHLARLRAHGPRRAEELREAARLLRALGVPPHLAEAAALRHANAPREEHDGGRDARIPDAADPPPKRDG